MINTSYGHSYDKLIMINTSYGHSYDKLIMINTSYGHSYDKLIIFPGPGRWRAAPALYRWGGGRCNIKFLKKIKSKYLFFKQNDATFIILKNNR